MNVTVFGGSQPQPGSPAYKEAYQLGKLLAQAKHTVLTGGYIGTMEAVSRGANEAGGHVIGVTCTDIETWRPVQPNRWVKEERRFKSLQERIAALIEGCDAALALPGGPGTLTEIATMWNLMIVESLHRRPLILIGDGWQSVFDQFFTSLVHYIPAHQKDLLTFAPNVETAVKILETSRG